MKTCESLCQQSNARACTEAGIAYKRGLGVPKDADLAVARLQKACQLGTAATWQVGKACFELGGMHDPIGFEWPRLRSAPQALSLYQRSCELNYALGCLRLADAYADKSLGLPEDKAKASALLEKSCSLREERACSRLSHAMPTSTPSETSHKLKYSIQHCRDMSIQPSRFAACEDAGLLLHQAGPANASKAAGYLTYACFSSSSTILRRSCLELAQMYETSELGNPNPALATCLYQRACQSGMDADPACQRLRQLGTAVTPKPPESCPPIPRNPALPDP